VRSIIIDALDMKDRESLHLVMKEALNLPDYYGNNLDALWDCLRDLPPTELLLRHAESLSSLPDGYGEKMIGLLREAVEEHPHFVFTLLDSRSGL